MSNWDELSLRDKAEFIKVGVRNGLTSISDIKEQYNKFQEINASAGNLVKAINENTKQEIYLGKPSHNYDFTQSEEWADAHGYYPDSRRHRDDRVKKSSHPTHPSRGYFKSMNQFDLSDKGFEDPNYILYGLNDGGQDPQAAMTYKGGIVLPELTVTPQGNYIYNSYDNVVNKLGGGGGLSKYGLVYDPKIKGWRNKSGNIEGGGFYRTLTNGRKVHFNTDGTVTHLDNYALQDFIRRIKQEENSKDNKKGGWNEEKQVWEPHSSYEGGEKTIAYGIKLFDADKTSPINKKYIDLANKQGYLTDEQANNAVVELGLSYMTQAKKVYDKKFQSGSWDKLSDKSKSILTDFQYNPGLSKFPSFMKAFNEGNIDNAYKEYKRYSGKNPLISRNKAIELDLDSIKNKFYTMHN